MLILGHVTLSLSGILVLYSWIFRSCTLWILWIFASNFRLAPFSIALIIIVLVVVRGIDSLSLLNRSKTFCFVVRHVTSRDLL